MSQYVIIFDRPNKKCPVCHGGKFLTANYDYCSFCQKPRVAYWTQYNSLKHILFGRYQKEVLAYRCLNRMKPFYRNGEYICQANI